MATMAMAVIHTSAQTATENDSTEMAGSSYTTLGEVTVEANQVIHSKGKMMIYPTKADVKASSSSLSLFQKLPLAGLEANPITRTLSVDGGTPYILINGVPATIDDFNALQPKDIDKIEYSRTTPARYADKGTSGFISITLKERKDGGSVYLWGRSALNAAFMDGNFQGSYHQGPSQFTLSYVPSWRNYKKVYDNVSQSYIGNDFRVNLEQHDRNPFNYDYHQIRLKYDFMPSEKILFSATFRATPSNSRRQLIGETKDSFLGDYNERNTTKSKDFAPSLDLYLRYDVNAKNSLEAQVVGTLSRSDYRRENTYLFTDGQSDNYGMDVDNRRRSLISEVNYIHSFSDAVSLSGGYQNTLSHSTNTYLTSDYKPVLTENNNYVYMRFAQQVGKVYYSVSTGAKLFWVKNDINKRHFVRNLTTAVVSWRLPRNWNLQGYFSYTPSIPSLASLTDYPQQTSPYLVSNGSPNLKVADRFYYSFTASYQYKKFSVSFVEGYSDIKNFVTDDVIYLGDRLFLSQSVNAKESRVLQESLNLKLSGVAGFGANVNLRLSHYRSAGEGWSHHLNSFGGSMSLWWNKGPFTVSYWRKFPDKYLSGHYVGKDENGDALSFEYKPDKHWNFGVDWMYMFVKKGTQYPSWSYSVVNPAVRERYIKNNGNMVTLSVTYTADFGSLFRTGRRSLNNSDNSSSLLRL